MKIQMNQIAFALALISVVASATASADMSIEQSRTFNSGGGSTTMKTGVAPSNFDPNLIAYRLTMVNGDYMGKLWAMTPEQPTAASWRAASTAVANGNVLAGNRRVGGSFLPTITGWVAWGIQSGFIDPDYYSQALGGCLTRESGMSGGLDGLVYRMQSCQVEAYIQSYAINPNGYAGGNLMGLVPLCEVQQQNDCNITGGAFNPMARLRAELAASAAKQKEEANNAKWSVMAKHSAAYQRYMTLKDGKTPGAPQ
ncbi:MAG: hypothetical protein J0I24_14580 [Thiomonas arsenitoxydans]|uniref:Uncharacterized protein n=1 Tax=Thiomonas arsenitoxydans (strain DSM 22701 / CIP 110005 / 3As) TaxID=426114 RepID=A0A8I1SXA5_THIA3|nr:MULTISPECIES: hypothetical protein [Thiomonas]MBN8745508.1 hypothetical protein [Thiomonas arsenitoxydans]ODU96304.1 MAG: hypothetical protein ABT24_09570 [Thiomonas sp. SCN 64-16]